MRHEGFGRSPGWNICSPSPQGSFKGGPGVASKTQFSSYGAELVAYECDAAAAAVRRGSLHRSSSLLPHLSTVWRQCTNTTPPLQFHVAATAVRPPINDATACVRILLSPSLPPPVPLRSSQTLPKPRHSLQPIYVALGTRKTSQNLSKF